MNKIPTTTNDQGREVIIVSHYIHCGQEWTSAWDSACDDECPICGLTVSPTDFEEVEVRKEEKP